MVDGYVAFEQFRSSGVGVRRVDRQGTVLRVHRQLAAARDGTAAAEYVAVRSDRDGAGADVSGNGDGAFVRSRSSVKCDMVSRVEFVVAVAGDIPGGIFSGSFRYPDTLSAAIPDQISVFTLLRHIQDNGFSVVRQ